MKKAQLQQCKDKEDKSAECQKNFSQAHNCYHHDQHNICQTSVFCESDPHFSCVYLRLQFVSLSMQMMSDGRQRFTRCSTPPSNRCTNEDLSASTLALSLQYLYMSLTQDNSQMYREQFSINSSLVRDNTPKSSSCNLHAFLPPNECLFR